MSAVPSLPTDTPGIHTNGTTNGVSSTPFKLNNTPVDNLRPLKVIVIGAGYSGIYCGIRIPEKLRNVELVIYEKNAGVGGTWYENRYGQARQSVQSCVIDFTDIWVVHATSLPTHTSTRLNQIHIGQIFTLLRPRSRDTWKA